MPKAENDAFKKNTATSIVLNTENSQNFFKCMHVKPLIGGQKWVPRKKEVKTKVKVK